MKKFLVTIVALASVLCAMAQTNERPIPIGVYVSDSATAISPMAYSLLEDKLLQIVTANGLGADNHASFFLTCSVNLTDKEVISGAPTRIIQNADVSFYIADMQTCRVYESVTISARGVGENENKAFVSVFKNIKPSSQEMKTLIANASKEIVAYYESQINNYIKQAEALAKLGEFEQALYILSVVPDVCEGYNRINDAAVDIYQKMIDNESLVMLQKAKTIWAAGHSYEAAMEAGEYLAEVSPYSTCYDKAEALASEIKEFVIAERAYDRQQAEQEIAWSRMMAEKEHALKEKEIDAWKAVGVAYGQNQPTQSYEMWWDHH